MKKITKFLPLLMSLMLVAPVFADDGTTTNSATNSATSEMDITIAPFINITRTAHVYTSQSTVDASYENLTVSTPLSATFQVINNLPGRQIALTATCPQNGTATSALYEYDDALAIVFGHSVNKPESSAISNITSGSPNKTQNANAFALTLTPLITAVANTGASLTEGYEASFNEGKVDYTLTNGIYTMEYDVGTESLANTFSTHDTNGKYMATLTLTDTTP